MPSPVGQRSRPRRLTQAERREATRTALLEATIECLVEFGYKNTTTGRVAELAGLSRGAQLNYFRSKAELVSAAVAHLAEKRIAEVSSLVEKLPEKSDRLPAMLDLLWEIHQGDIFDATLDLWVAARTDTELRAPLVELERDVMRRSLAVAAEALPERAARPGFADDLEAVLAMLRGLAMVRTTSGESRRGMSRRWAVARERLLRMLD